MMMLLLFLALSLILTLTMLNTMGNEVVIAGFHRDGVRALELAQAGIQEAARRVEGGRPFINGFTSSMNSGVTVTVVRRLAGPNSAGHPTVELPRPGEGDFVAGQHRHREQHQLDQQHDLGRRLLMDVGNLFVKPEPERVLCGMADQRERPNVCPELLHPCSMRLRVTLHAELVSGNETIREPDIN